MRYGTMSVETLVEQAAGKGVPALVLTDINNSTGTMDFIKACREHGVHPVAGIEFRDRNRLLFTGIARNNEGFRELNEFLSACNISKVPLPHDPPPFRNAYIVFPFGRKTPSQLLDNEYLGIRPAEIRRLFSSPFRNRQEKLLINQPVTFGSREDYAIHTHLRAVDNNTLLSKINGVHLAAKDEHFRSQDELLEAFRSYPEIIGNTEYLIGDCHIGFDFSTIKNKDCFTGSRYDDKLLLEKLAFDGLLYRYGKNNPEARRRVTHELGIIDRLGFSAYFLITWDVIRYSMSRGFYHVGRGSGANSIVAYCLKITD
ncbi:MAG: PHP domain-containing protein, partial [Bacteroidales bacterium]|nr:PHP domain-containing protein [Bacteroidales bacterium]